MPRYAVEYTYVEDVPKRHAVRPRHRDYLAGLAAEGVLLLAGPWAADDGALLAFEAADEAALRGYLDADPYKAAEVISETRITEWNPLLGAWVS
ncbi:YciI family protein [Kutzneria viridogrisea]|uniref:YCII-related domain-containing protein n=2 Tax=Kutzneria TaxID=43356 RepID=W5WL75_9PSEU|nr:YciI family protein [Kutzneria albida]AHI01969.1 hypothetical protein KALB_8612 [Kutzneria albida DSM 43870]MBA8929608.1 hypothetical protein [Kutzneria viridogrisea]